MKGVPALLTGPVKISQIHIRRAFTRQTELKSRPHQKLTATELDRAHLLVKWEATQIEVAGQDHG